MSSNKDAWTDRNPPLVDHREILEFLKDRAEEAWE